MYKIQWYDTDIEEWQDDESCHEFPSRFEAENEARHIRSGLCYGKYRIVKT